MMDPLRISVSRALRFARCQRSYYLHYIEGLEPLREAEALSIGKAYHAGVEALDTGLSTSEAIQAAGRFAPQNRMKWAKTRAMVEAYAREPISAEIHHVELPFELPAGDGVIVVGRIDAIATLPTGETVVVERKTRGRTPDDVWFEGLARRLQTRVYSWAARELDEVDSPGVYYDVCEKPSIRPRKGRKKDGSDKDTPETYHDRCLEKVTFHRRLIEPAGDDPQWELRAWARKIREAEQSGLWPCSEDRCNPVVGQACRFRDLCYSNNNPLVRDMYYRVNPYRAKSGPAPF